LERKTLDLSAKLGNFAIKRQATWGMSVHWPQAQKSTTPSFSCFIQRLLRIFSQFE
jgi:hypothetical protein